MYLIATGAARMMRTASIGRIQDGSISGCGSINHVNRSGDSWNGELHSNKSTVWCPTAMNGVKLLNVPSTISMSDTSPSHVISTTAPSGIVSVTLDSFRIRYPTFRWLSSMVNCSSEPSSIRDTAVICPPGAEMCVFPGTSQPPLLVAVPFSVID